MCSMLDSIDRVHEAKDSLIVSGIIPQSNFNYNILLFLLKINNIMQGLFIFIDVGNIALDSPLKVILGFFIIFLVDKININPLVQVSQFFQPVIQDIVIEADVCKNLSIRQK